MQLRAGARFPAQKQDTLILERVDGGDDRRVGQRDLALHPVDLAKCRWEQVGVCQGLAPVTPPVRPTLDGAEVVHR